MLSGWVGTILANKAAGGKRPFVAMEVLDNGLDQFWRKLSVSSPRATGDNADRQGVGLDNHG